MAEVCYFAASCCSSDVPSVDWWTFVIANEHGIIDNALHLKSLDSSNMQTFEQWFKDTRRDRAVIGLTYRQDVLEGSRIKEVLLRVKAAFMDVMSYATGRLGTEPGNTQGALNEKFPGRGTDEGSATWKLAIYFIMKHYVHPSGTRNDSFFSTRFPDLGIDYASLRERTEKLLLRRPITSKHAVVRVPFCLFDEIALYTRHFTHYDAEFRTALVGMNTGLENADENLVRQHALAAYECILAGSHKKNLK